MTEQNEILEVNVQFGGISFGDQTARLGISFDRGDFKVCSAEKFMVGARLRIVAIPGVRDATAFRQLELMDAGKRVQADVDCKQYTGGSHAFKSGLTFNVSSVDQTALLALRKKQGRISLERIGSCDDEDEDDDEMDPDEREFEAGKDRPKGTPLLFAAAAARRGRAGNEDDPAKNHSLETLSKKGLQKLAEKMDAADQYDGQGVTDKRIESIKEFLNVKTVTELENYMSANRLWHKEIHRFGDEAVNQVSDAIVLFRKLVGYPSDEEAADVEGGGEEKHPGYMDANTSDDEAYTLGANAAVASGDSEDPATNPFPPGTRAADGWQKGFNETNSASVASDDDSGSMLSDENTEDVEVDQDSEAVETE